MKFLFVTGKQCLVTCKGVQIGQVIPLIKELLRVPLAMDVDELKAQLPQNGNGKELPVDPADVLPIQVNLPLNESLLLIGHPVFLEPG